MNILRLFALLSVQPTARKLRSKFPVRRRTNLGDPGALQWQTLEMTETAPQCSSSGADAWTSRYDVGFPYPGCKQTRC